MSRPLAVFVGPMGAGKTRIGKQVARALGADFTDTDRAIVALHGPISDIFALHGEPHFRALEREAVSLALNGSGVVSLGGGAVLDPDTRADLARLTVIYLTISAEAVERRLGKKRPLLQNGVADWQRIFAERRSLYEEVATINFDTTERTREQISADIVRWLKGRQGRE